MPRVLVVDDEPGITSLLSSAFRRHGFEVRTAGNARDAMAMCTTESFDAVLTDVQMPRVNGHDLVQWVMAHHPSVRCVLMSAFYDRDCQDCPFLSRCHFLPKPFTTKQAVSLIEKVLSEPPLDLA